MLFNILKDHGQLFSCTFWISVLKSVVFPIFGDATHTSGKFSPGNKSPRCDENPWSSETHVVAAQCLVDLFVTFYDVLQSQLPNVVLILTSLIRSPNQSYASTGVAALVHLAGSLGSGFFEKEWGDIFMSLKEAAEVTVPEFLKVLRIMDDIEVPDAFQAYADAELYSDLAFTNDDLEDDSLHTASYIVARMKGHISVQLLILQVPSLSLVYVLATLKFDCMVVWFNS